MNGPEAHDTRVYFFNFSQGQLLQAERTDIALFMLHTHAGGLIYYDPVSMVMNYRDWLCIARCIR